MSKVDRVVVKRRVRHTKGGATYVDDVTQMEMQLVGWAYRGPKYPKGTPVKLVVEAYCEAPRKQKAESEPYTVKPDIDNVVKCVMDGLNGVAWDDDCQVTQLVASKLPRKKGGGSWTKFSVSPVEED